MRNVFQSRTGAEAALVRNLLEANGIPAQLNDRTPNWTGQHGCSEVWIPDGADAVLATKLIRDLYARRAVPENPWRCRRCREENPEAFEVCWHCGSQHGE